MNDDLQTYKCPLCESILTRENWVKITGQWEENRKLIEANEKELAKAKKKRLSISRGLRLIKEKLLEKQRSKLKLRE